MNNNLDMMDDPGIDTEKRNAELDADLLKGGESIAGITLRPITAGDLAILMQSGVGIVLGRTDNLTYDTGAILFTQSQPKEIVREAFRGRDTSGQGARFPRSVRPNPFR